MVHGLSLLTFASMERTQEVLQDVVIKFAGDSGDGMQLTGTQFTNNTALLGSDLSTFPDFPADVPATTILASCQGARRTRRRRRNRFKLSAKKPEEKTSQATCNTL